MATLKDIIYAVRVRLAKFTTRDIGDTPLIDLVNLGQEDLISELPANSLVFNTRSRRIASVISQERYDLPTNMHRFLNLLQNADGGPEDFDADLASPAAAGNIENGVHLYAVTFVIGATESQASDRVSVTVVDKTVNGQVLVTLPVGPEGTVSRKIYRTAANASTLKLLATQADNTATSYTDNTADAGLGAAYAVAAPTLLGIPSGIIGEDELFLVKNEPTAYQTDALERPRHWFGDQGFLVYPVPAVTRMGYFVMSYIAKPDRMVRWSDTCAFDQQYTEAVIWKAVLKALTALKEPTGDAAAQYAENLKLTGISMGDTHKIA